MNSIKQNLTQALSAVWKTYSDKDLAIKLQVPEHSSFGDYSTNIAMVGFPQVTDKFKSPAALAEQIKFELEKNPQLKQLISAIKIDGPGFLNFFLSEKYLAQNLQEFLQTDAVGLHTDVSGKKITVEFTDPNPFKEFHIGHLYNNIVGESISRLLEAQGAQVRRVCYQGDVGLHVAKSLYGILQQLKTKNLELRTLEEKSLEERVKFLGEGYALGAKTYEEDSQAKEEINELNKKVYEHDPSINELYQKGRKWSLEYFERIYKRLGTKFEDYYFESEVGNKGVELVNEHLKDGIFEKSEGAVIFPGKKYGLHNRVFMNSLGLPTYEAKELGLAPLKYKDFPYDQSIIVTGNEINEYFRVLLKALSLINPDLAEKTNHISHGMVRLKSGKMSSRTGNLLTGEWLLDEAKRELVAAYPDISDEVAEQVALAAVKYAMLRGSIGKDVLFDFKESINLQGNSGPYLQYTYARTRSVLHKAGMSNFPAAAGSSGSRDKFQISNVKLKVEDEELTLLRSLIHFPEIVEDAGTQYAPHLLGAYLFNLAHGFNEFYQKNPILNQEESVTQFRLALTQAVGKVIKQGLYLLGIPAPEKM